MIGITISVRISRPGLRDESVHVAWPSSPRLTVPAFGEPRANRRDTGLHAGQGIYALTHPPKTDSSVGTTDPGTLAACDDQPPRQRFGLIQPCCSPRL